jgi:hypothetical protein
MSLDLYGAFLYLKVASCLVFGDILAYEENVTIIPPYSLEPSLDSFSTISCISSKYLPSLYFSDSLTAFPYLQPTHVLHCRQ